MSTIVMQSTLLSVLQDADAAARRIRPAGLAFLNSGSFKLAMHSTTSGFKTFSVGSPAGPVP